MRQKYMIIRQPADQQMIIQEYAELDKEVMSLLCEERYGEEAILKSLKGGREALAQSLKTRNLYPPDIYALRLAEAIETLYSANDNQSIEVFFDDLELLNREGLTIRPHEEIEEEPEDIDDLLDEDFEADYEEDGPIGNINSPIKIADDDPVDLEDEI